MTDYLYIPARNFTPAKRTKVDVVVLHTTENFERPGIARDVALWFAGISAPQASAHFVVDAREVYRCVLERDVSWAAPGANANGIHIELCGRAAQTEAEWDDEYSKAVLLLAARVAAEVCIRWQIPPVAVDVAGLLRRERGLTTHAAVSEAFKKSTHTDPGAGFPMARFVREVERMACALDETRGLACSKCRRCMPVTTHCTTVRCLGAALCDDCYAAHPCATEPQ